MSNVTLQNVLLWDYNQTSTIWTLFLPYCISTTIETSRKTKGQLLFENRKGELHIDNKLFRGNKRKPCSHSSELLVYTQHRGSQANGLHCGQQTKLPRSSFQYSPWTLNLTDWVTFPAIFVATQRYIPLSEMRVSVIFIDPEGRNVCLGGKPIHQSIEWEETNTPAQSYISEIQLCCNFWNSPLHRPTGLWAMETRFS